MNADGIFNYFASRISYQGFFREPLLTLQSSQERVLNQMIYITAPYQGSRYKPIITELHVMVGDDLPGVSITRQQLANFIEFANRHSDANYRNVKSNQLWRDIYGVANASFPSFDPKTGTSGTKQALGTYCQRCHFILPLSVLTIDHQKPQSGGGQDALARLFRALGLTKSTGYGVKNRLLQNAFAQYVGGSQDIRLLGDKGGKEDRFSLTSMGMLYYSALRYAGDLPALKTLAMHHVVNLRPMCGPCNSSLRNTNVTFG